MDLITAKQHLEAWLQAELAVSTGQSYKIGTRELNRANLYQIREQIKFWQRQVARLQSKGKRKVFRAVPRDL